MGHRWFMGMQVFLSTFWSCSTWWRWLRQDSTDEQAGHTDPAQTVAGEPQSPAPATQPRRVGRPAQGLGRLLWGRGRQSPALSPVLQSPRAPHLKVPRSTSWPLSRMWMPSFSREPKAMYSARAQSTVLFFTISPRVFRMRLSPAETRCSPAIPLLPQAEQASLGGRGRAPVETGQGEARRPTFPSTATSEGHARWQGGERAPHSQRPALGE